MRFEEVSAPVETRIVSVATTCGGNLATELHGLFGVFNSTFEDVRTATASLDVANATNAVTRAAAPGGLASVLLATALLLHVLKAFRVRSAVRRLMNQVRVLASSANDGGLHVKAD